MGLENVVYVVDYDLSTNDESKRTYFYRKLHRKMRKLYGAMEVLNSKLLLRIVKR